MKMKSDLRSSFETIQQYMQRSDEALFCYTSGALICEIGLHVHLSEPRTQMHLHHYSLPCLAGDPDVRMQECVEQSRVQRPHRVTPEN